MNISEIKTGLNARYPYRIELHAHSNPVSRCSEISPRELVQLYADQGFHGVTLTNHFTPELSNDADAAIDHYLQDYADACDAGAEFGVAVYLGAELRFAENYNDYLLYGVDAPVLRTCLDYLNKGVEAFRREVRLPDSVFLQAHPFRNGMQLCDPALLDGMECMNAHPNHNSRVAMATRYAYEQNLKVKIAGTDFHHPTHQGLSALRAQTLPQNSFELAKILKAGNLVFELGDHSFWIP